MAAQALGVAALPVLTRLYSVSDFGYLQIYASLLMALTVIAALRYEVAVLIAEDGESAGNTLAVAIFCVVGSATLAALVVAVAFRFHLATRLAGSFAPWLWSLPLAMLAAGMVQVQTNWALRHKHFGGIASTKVSQIATQLTTQTAAGILRPSVWGLIGGDLTGRVVSNLTLAWTNRNDAFDALRKSSSQGMRTAARRYREFPLFSSGSALLNTGGVVMPALLIGYFYGAKVLGLYALVDRVLGAPTFLVGQGISQVYMAEGGRLATTAPEALHGIFVRTFKRLLQVAMPPAVVIALFAPHLFAFALGPQWREAGVYAQLLVPRSLLAFAVWPLSTTLLLLERQRLQLAWDAGRLILTVGVIWGSYRYINSPRVTLASYAIAMLLGYGAYAWICHRVLRGRKNTVRQVAAAGSPS
jgi:O-antigen/teichoic acid export membrane protein